MKNKIFLYLKSFIEKKIPILSRLYRNIRDNRKIYQEPKLINLGFKFNGNSEMESGKFEPAETQTVINLMNQVDSVINVGANIGYYCCLAAHFDKNVVAFEPIAQNLKYLLRNIKANKWERKVEVYPMAMSNEIDVLNMFGSGTGASLVKGWAGVSSAYKSLVPLSTLDNIISNRFLNDRLLIIIDVEGSELNTLKGASCLFNRETKPIWMVEISYDDHQPKSDTINPNLIETFKIFLDKGYVAKTIELEPKPVTLDQILEIIDSKDLILSSHNFLFYDPKLQI